MIYVYSIKNDQHLKEKKIRLTLRWTMQKRRTPWKKENIPSIVPPNPSGHLTPTPHRPPQRKATPAPAVQQKKTAPSTQQKAEPKPLRKQNTPMATKESKTKQNKKQNRNEESTPPVLRGYHTSLPLTSPPVTH
jgi:hypothetical protein